MPFCNAGIITLFHELNHILRDETYLVSTVVVYLGNWVPSLSIVMVKVHLEMYVLPNTIGANLAMEIREQERL